MYLLQDIDKWWNCKIPSSTDYVLIRRTKTTLLEPTKRLHWSKKNDPKPEKSCRKNWVKYLNVAGEVHSAHTVQHKYSIFMHIFEYVDHLPDRFRAAALHQYTREKLETNSIFMIITFIYFSKAQHSSTHLSSIGEHKNALHLFSSVDAALWRWSRTMADRWRGEWMAAFLTRIFQSIALHFYSH